MGSKTITKLLLLDLSPSRGSMHDRLSNGARPPPHHEGPLKAIILKTWERGALPHLC